MSELRDAQVIPLSKHDRKLLSAFGVKVIEGSRTEADDLAFAREITDDGFYKLTENHFADVAQTAIDALPFFTKKVALKRLADAEARASFLASIEYWQKQLIAAEAEAERESA